ncbi:MAG: YceI family protein [Chitinophagaceae bacterium]|nr:YceI family protein [Chitinophagaceae bacterium]
MKKVIFSIAAATMFLASCQDAPKADNATTGEAQEVTNAAGTAYPADIAQSKLEFVGTKPVGQHHGTIGIKEGMLMVDGESIKGGSFVFDMNTLKADDQDEEGNGKLTGHLMSPDFFDVASFPTASFEISNVAVGVDTSIKDLMLKDATHTITGNLTMKGVVKSISFPAKVNVNGSTVTSDANFNIDRTDWGLSYGNDESLKDKFIRPIVNIGFHLVAVQNATATASK